MIIGVPKEIADGERRVGLVPEGVKALKKLGVDLLIETGAGLEAGFDDQSYLDEEARVRRIVAGEDDLIRSSQARTHLMYGSRVTEAKAKLERLGLPAD